MDSNIIINGHFLNQQITGVQRYASEIIKRWKGNYIIAESNYQRKLFRHLWMHIQLSKRLDNNSILWSPTNIGPLNVSRQVLTLHDVADFVHPDWFSSSYTLYRKSIIPRLVKKIEGIITVSNYSKNMIVDIFQIPDSKVKVIYNGVNKSLFFPANVVDINKTKRIFEIEKNYMLTLGSLDPRKNLESIISAWNVLNQEKNLLDTELVIVGGASKTFKNSENNKYRSIDNVRYLGYVDDKYLSPLYSGAELFIYPSMFEGFGLPVLEAMCCKTPIITSRGGALEEISGKASYLVDPYNIYEIAEGIYAVLNSKELQEDLIKKGVQHCTKFSWEKTSTKTYNYLSSFIN